MGPPPFTRGIRGWVLVILEDLYGRVSLQGLSWGTTYKCIGTVDSRGLEESQFVGDHYGMIVATTFDEVTSFSVAISA